MLTNLSKFELSILENDYNEEYKVYSDIIGYSLDNKQYLKSFDRSGNLVLLVSTNGNVKINYYTLDGRLYSSKYFNKTGNYTIEYPEVTMVEWFDEDPTRFTAKEFI